MATFDRRARPPSLSFSATRIVGKICDDDGAGGDDSDGEATAEVTRSVLEEGEMER